MSGDADQSARLAGQQARTFGARSAAPIRPGRRSGSSGAIRVAYVFAPALAAAESATPNVTTVLVSALVSAGVAAIVSVVVTFVAGVPLEIRKQRATRRDAARSELLESLRLQLNAVGLLRRGQRGWTTLEGRVTEFTDTFDEQLASMEADYRSSLRHFVANDDEPER